MHQALTNGRFAKVKTPQNLKPDYPPLVPRSTMPHAAPEQYAPQGPKVCYHTATPLLGLGLKSFIFNSSQAKIGVSSQSLSGTTRALRKASTSLEPLR